MSLVHLKKLLLISLPLWVNTISATSQLLILIVMLKTSSKTRTLTNISTVDYTQKTQHKPYNRNKIRN